MRVCRNFAKEKAREEPRLNLEQTAHRDLVAEERMRCLLIEPPFVSGSQSSPCIATQIAAARAARSRKGSTSASAFVNGSGTKGACGSVPRNSNRNRRGGLS